MQQTREEVGVKDERQALLFACLPTDDPVRKVPKKTEKGCTLVATSGTYIGAQIIHQQIQRFLFRAFAFSTMPPPFHTVAYVPN